MNVIASVAKQPRSTVGHRGCFARNDRGSGPCVNLKRSCSNEFHRAPSFMPGRPGQESLPPMRVIGLAGWSGAGKTTLLVRLIPALMARGLAVSTVKHAHHKFDVDSPETDSWKFREAGADEVLVASDARWVLLRELRDEPEPELPALLARMDRVDLVVIEGFKREHHP